MADSTEHILIIDPDSQSRRELARYLEDKGFYVVTRASLQTAVNLLNGTTPDAIFADLPPATIHQLIHQKPLSERSTPLIAFTRAERANEVVDALRAGASDFVIKPLGDTAALDDVLAKLFERLRLARLNQVYRRELEGANRDLRAGISELRADQNAGRKVQMKMLPENRRTIGDWQFAHMVKPSLYLSGDFLDYVRLDDHRTLVYIADVSGHGASSAFVTVLLKNLTNRLQRNLRRGSSHDILSPRHFLARVNKELKDTQLGKHVTMFVALMDARNRTMQYSVAAHFPMPILSSHQGTAFLEGTGLPVGIFDEPHWEEYECSLPPGFHLVLFSDGILEVIEASGLDHKERRLLELVAAGRHTILALSDALGLDQIDELPDDIAIVTVTDELVDAHGNLQDPAG
ncbi:MAG: SpoIIE family protein phosphatase [Oleiphilaceae bacterium]|nr:SpoIIE family protein phosphatase [Oleiphilaceae bacterium]